MTDRARIVGAGMGGLIGRSLAERLAASYDVIRLVRPASRGTVPGTRSVEWIPPLQGTWETAIDGAAAVVNLAGESVAGGRWTPARKKTLIESRLVTTRTLVEAIGRAKTKPRVLVSASAVGFYGNRGDEILTEESKPSSGFLSDLCREWERQAMKAEAFGVRVVLLRTGVVLDPHGGALAKMLPPFRLGLGGPLGSGRQYLSWIHRDDEIDAIRWAIETGSASGPYNLSAPEPATMKDFSSALGRALGRPAVLPAPAFALKLVFGEMSEILLGGQRAVPARLSKEGFRHRYPGLEGALADLTARQKALDKP